MVNKLLMPSANPLIKYRDKHQSSTPASQPPPKEDNVYNHGCATIAMGLLLSSMDNAVREGDGQRICRGWKLMLPLFKAHGHTKYAYAAPLFQVKLQALLSLHKSHNLMWNWTENDKGGSGRRKSQDLKLEHLNHVATDATYVYAQVDCRKLHGNW